VKVFKRKEGKILRLRGFYVSRFTTILLACIHKLVNGEQTPFKICEYFHATFIRCAIVVGIAVLITGLEHLGDRYDVENSMDTAGLWQFGFISVALVVIYLDYREKQRIRRKIFERSNWVLRNLEEDDSLDLLNN